LNASLIDNLLGHAGLPSAGNPDFQRKSSIAVPSASGQRRYRHLPPGKHWTA
jgi:hypothetical protein